MTDPVISTADLAARLGDVRIVDATWFLPTEPRTGAQAYAEAHIPGAVFFDIDALSDRTSDLPHMLPTPEAFAASAGAMGLDRNTDIVVYDANGLFSAPRVWWTLRVNGFDRVKVLDGGLRKWLAEGRPVTTEVPSPAARPVSPEFRPELVRDLTAVRHALAGAAQVIDARPGARFRGEVPEPRPGLRAGHMPGALSQPFGEVANPEGTLKSADDLRTVFSRLDLAAPIVASCGSGVTAAVLALALARLGRGDVAIYDGSWAEWGGRADAEVATGA